MVLKSEGEFLVAFLGINIDAVSVMSSDLKIK